MAATARSSTTTTRGRRDRTAGTCGERAGGVASFPTYTSRHPAHVRQPPEQPVPAPALITDGWQPQDPHLVSRCVIGGRLSEARIAADLAPVLRLVARRFAPDADGYSARSWGSRAQPRRGSRAVAPAAVSCARQVRFQAGPRTWRALDAQYAACRRDAVGQAAQPGSGGPGAAGSVVADLHHEPLVDLPDGDL